MSRLNKFDSQFKDLLQARKVNRLDRYQLENTIKAHTVSSHTHWVSILSLIILDETETQLKKKYHRSINKQALMEIALFHDFGESVTGDIDFIAKRAGVVDTKAEGRFIHSRFNSSGPFSKYLDAIMVDHIEEHEWDLEKKIVKCADILEHLVYCYEEQELFGNPSMYEPLSKGVSVVHDKFREFYEMSGMVEEITDHSERVIKNNPLS